jgi:subtilisin family serine protease
LPKLPALALVLLLAVPGFPAGALGGAAAIAPEVAPPRIAIIDTGIDPTHREFDEGQVVAWWAFTAEGKPGGPALDPYSHAAGARAWDPYVEPFDLDGHGTATASLAAGHDRGACGADAHHRKLSFAPGAELVVAKVSSRDPLRGTIVDGDLALAIDWAVDMGADVISMSIGAIVPYPLHFDESSLDRARARGVLVVVSAGNGLGNTGMAPFPTWSTSYGNSKSVLAVGGATHGGSTLGSLTGNLDPDVVSWSDGVCVAALAGGYRRMTGTSFSTPLVAGMAAQAMALARAHGASDDDERIERILLLAARNDPLSPYAREGMGFLLDAEWATVRAHATSGTLPQAGEEGTHETVDLLYHDVVLERARNTPFL